MRKSKEFNYTKVKMEVHACLGSVKVRKIVQWIMDLVY